jgi:hypothetical protein
MAVAPDPTVNASALAFLADEDLFTLEVGNVAVDLPLGRLRRADERFPIKFGFNFSNHAFEAQATQGHGDIVIDCAMTLCRLPYSIEDRKRRADLTRVLGGLGGTGLKWEVGNDQVIRVGIRIHLDPPATAARVVAALVEHLLPSKGYLDLLLEIARRPKTRPALPAPREIVAEAAIPPEATLPDAEISPAPPHPVESGRAGRGASARAPRRPRRPARTS